MFGWVVLVRVDGVTYSFLGASDLSVINGTTNLTNVAVTPTQTVVTAKAGPMEVNLTFLNPIEVCLCSSIYFKCLQTRHSKPGNWVNQSIPFSYIAFTAQSLDGSAHALQMYTDVSGGM